MGIQDIHLGIIHILESIIIMITFPAHVELKSVELVQIALCTVPSIVDFTGIKVWTNMGVCQREQWPLRRDFIGGCAKVNAPLALL